MPDTPETLPEKRGRGFGVPFKAGHPKYGGRKKGSVMKRTAHAQDIADRMGFHPVEWLVRVAVDGVMLNPDGTETVCDSDQRLDAAKSAAKYLVPVPHASMEKDEPAVDIRSIDIDRMMQDPALVEAAQRLSLAANHAPMLPAPEPEIPLDIVVESDDGVGDD